MRKLALIVAVVTIGALASGARAQTEVVPVPGRSVVVGLVEGTVTVRPPGQGSFTPIGGLVSIPVGSELDTTRGVVALSSRPTGGALQSAQFKFGRFRIAQTARKGAFTELKLTGALGCGASSAAGGPPATAAGKRGRTLWGSGKGKFRTRGRKGSGSARGTTWQVTDLCNRKTRIKSIKGKVKVRDFIRKRSLTLRTGEGYSAPGPKKLRP